MVQEVAEEVLSELRQVEMKSQVERVAESILDDMLLSATRSTCKQSLRQNNQSIESGIDLLCENMLEASITECL